MEINVAASGHDFRIAPSTRIGYVSLNVSDVDKSVDFYESVLGFKAVDRSSTERALLSVDGHQSYLVELLQAKDLAGSSDTRTRMAGLYHFAVLLPERKFLAGMLQNLIDRRGEVRFEGLANHLVSESIYIRDADGIGIEIYCDRPSSEWEWDGDKVRMATKELDTADLLRESKASGWKAMPAKTLIGHVHLHVSNLAKSMKFYSEVLGLNFRASYPGAYFFAAGRYHHHVAINTWLGAGIPAASPEKMGLNYFAIDLQSPDELDRTLKHVSSLVGENQLKSNLVQDPDGIRIRLQSR